MDSEDEYDVPPTPPQAGFSEDYAGGTDDPGLGAGDDDYLSHQPHGEDGMPGNYHDDVGGGLYDDEGRGGGEGDEGAFDEPFHDGMEAAAAAGRAAGAAEVGSEMTYDYPGNELHGFGNVVPPSPAGNQFGQSAGSQGFANASVSSLPEEIEINTHGLINETVERLSFIHGVLGVLIIDREGLIVHATMPMEEAAQLTGPVLQMLSRARECAKLGLGPGDDGEPLSMLTVRTRKHEMLLCSEQSGAFAICVLQDPTPSMDQSALVFDGKRALKS